MGWGWEADMLRIAARNAPEEVKASAHKVCTPEQPDSVTIRQAFDRAGLRNSGAELLAGTYTLDEPLPIEGAGYFTFKGSGRATVLKPSAAFPANRGLIEFGYGDGTSARYTNNVTISDLTLDGDAQRGSLVHGIRGGGYMCEITGVKVLNTSGWGFHFWSPNPSNKTDLMVSRFILERNLAGGMCLGRESATDAHFEHFIIMYAGRAAAGTTARQDADSIEIDCGSVQFSEFQTYSPTRHNLNFTRPSKLTRVTNGKIENAPVSGIYAPNGLNQVFVSGSNFRGGDGARLVNIDTRAHVTLSLDGCWFHGDAEARWPSHYLALNLGNGGSRVTMTGGGMHAEQDYNGAHLRLVKLAKSGAGQFRAANVQGFADVNVPGGAVVTVQ
jgi:hypothetical protein